MKVYEIRAFGLEGLKLAERPQPQPGPFELLLKVRAASLNYRDLMMLKGTYNPKMQMPRVPLGLPPPCALLRSNLLFSPRW